MLAQVRSVGRRRREKTDWYTLVLGIVIFAGLPVQAAIGLATKPGDGGDPVARFPVAVALAAALLAAMLLLAAAMTLGPLRMSPAEFSWVLSGPVDRSRELQQRWWNGVAISGFFGAGLTALGTALTGAGLWRYPWHAVAGFAVGILLYAVATGLQELSAGRRRAVRVVGMIGTVAAFGATAILDRLHVRVPSVPMVVAIVVAAVAALLAAAAVARGRRAIPRLDRLALTEGNATAGAAGAAVLFLDPALLGDVLAERRYAQVRVDRSRSFPAGRFRGLVAAEFVRAMRNRRAAGTVLGCLLVPWALSSVIAPEWVPVLVLLAAVPAVSGFGSGLRLVCRSAALRSMLGGRDLVLRAAHLVLPATVAIGFSLAAAAAAFPIRWAALALVPFGVIANLWFRATAKPLQFDGQVLDLGFGPVPVAQATFLLRGIGPLALTIGIQLLL